MTFQYRFTTLLILMAMSIIIPATGALAAGNGRDLTIYYSNDVHGKTEPCG